MKTIIKTKTGKEYYYYGEMEEKHGDALEHMAYLKEKGYKPYMIEMTMGFLVPVKGKK